MSRATFDDRSVSVETLSRSLAEQHVESLQRIDVDSRAEPWGRSEWLLDLPDKWKSSQIAWDAGRPVGFLIASRKGRLLHVHRLAVVEEARRRRLGLRLMAAAACKALECGCEEMSLKVHPENAPAIALYERLGFSLAQQDVHRWTMTARAQTVRAWAEQRLSASKLL